MSTEPARYRIRVQGQVGPEWSEWFSGLTITSEEPNETILFGPVVDQAALYGIPIPWGFRCARSCARHPPRRRRESLPQDTQPNHGNGLMSSARAVKRRVSL